MDKNNMNTASDELVDFRLFSLTVKICLSLVILAMLLASINPLALSSYLLHQAGTLIALMIFLGLRHIAKVSDKAFVGATLFLLVHIVGARYLYSYVPYDEWLQRVFGFSLGEWMNWQRNMYDRLVHFCYGLLLYGYFYQVLRHFFVHSYAKQLFLLVLMLNMSTSLIYEWLEWLLAIGLSPEQAEAYNGQQGDMWDAHKDMLLALMGSVCAIFGGLVFGWYNPLPKKIN